VRLAYEENPYRLYMAKNSYTSSVVGNNEFILNVKIAILSRYKVVWCTYVINLRDAGIENKYDGQYVLALGLEEHTQTKQYATTVSHYVFKR
jgi:hypothetical protein